MRRNVVSHLIVAAALTGSVHSISAVSAAAQSKTTIPEGAQVYIDRGAQLENDIRAELERQKVSLQIVSAEDQAQYVIRNSESVDLRINKIDQGISSRVRRTGTLTVREKSSNTVVWSADWKVNSYNPKEERRAVSDLVGKLKKRVR